MTARLTDLQDRLGHIHDMNVLHNRLEEAVSEAAAAHAQVGLRTALAAPGAAALKHWRRRDPVPGLIALACLTRTEAHAGHNGFMTGAWRVDGEPFLKKDMDQLGAGLLRLPVAEGASFAE